MSWGHAKVGRIRASAGRGFLPSAFLAVAMLGMPGTVNAVVLTFSEPAVEMGSTADLIILADDASGIEGLSLHLTYNPAVVGVASDVAVTDNTSRCMVVSNSRVPGLVRIGLACVEPLRGSGPLLTVRLLGRGPGRSELKIANCNLNEGAMACNQLPGLATVQTVSNAPADAAGSAPANLARAGTLAP